MLRRRAVARSSATPGHDGARAARSERDAETVLDTHTDSYSHVPYVSSRCTMPPAPRNFAATAEHTSVSARRRGGVERAPFRVLREGVGTPRNGTRDVAERNCSVARRRSRCGRNGSSSPRNRPFHHPALQNSAADSKYQIHL